MADETQNVVLDFKMNGQVQFANTVKDINAVMNTAAKEYRAQISSMDENASSTQKLAAEQQKLQIQSEAAAKRTQILSEQLKTMQDRGETSGSSFDRLVGKVADAQRVENNLKGALDQVNSQLSEQGSKANDAKDHISNLQQEEGELDSKLKLASSSAKLENAQLGDNASESKKTAAAQRQLSEQIDLSRQKVDNLTQQLKETVTAYGKNSAEANQMATRLNTAKTSVANLENQMSGLGEKSKASSGALGTLREKLSLGAIAGAASNAVSAVTGGIGQLVSEGIEASDSMNKFDSTMTLAGFGKENIKKAGEAVQDYANKTVYDLATVSNTTAQLAANGVRDYTGLTQAAGNLNAQAGGNADTFKSVAMVMTQTAGAGKLTTENWNQLADAIPGASGKLQEAMKKNGAYTGNFRDAMEKGEISAGEFNKAISDLGMTKAAKDAAASTATFEGAFGNLEANIVTGIQNIITSLGKANLTNMINTLSNGVVGAFKLVVSALKTIQDHATAFKTLAVSVGVFFAAFKTVQTINNVVNVMKEFNNITKISTAVQKAFNLAMGMNPFTLIVAAIVAVVAALGYFFTQTKAGKEVWQNFITWLKSAWTGVVNFAKNLWTGLSSFFKQLWTSIKRIFTIAINAITNFLKPAFTAAANVIKSIWNGIKSFFSALWNGIKVIFTVAITAIAVIIGTYLNIWKTIITTAMNLIKGIITNVWNGIKSFFGPILASIGNVIRSAWNSISSVTSSVFNEVKSVVSSIWNNIKNVVSNVVNAVKSVVSNAWNAVSSTTSNIFNSVKSAVSNVWNSIKSTISNVVGSIRNAVSSAWNAVSSVTSNVWDSIKNAISGPINTAKDIVRGAIDAIRGFFNFSINWPHIPMPHFSIQPSGWSVGDLLHGSIPHLGIDWYAQGGIMTQPTMFANNNGRAQVGGEAGPEGVIPLNDDTWNKMGAAIAAHMPSQGPITLQVDGRTFATITGPYTSDYLKQQDATQNFSYGRRL